MKVHSIMKQVTSHKTSIMGRVIFFSWVALAAAALVWITTAMIGPLISPEADYEYGVSSGAIDDCFGLDKVISTNSTADETVTESHSMNESDSGSDNISCEWIFYVEDDRAGWLLLNFTIDPKAPDRPNEEMMTAEQESGSAIIADGLDGYDYGFCHDERPSADTSGDTAGGRVTDWSPTQFCEARDSNLHLRFAMNGSLLDLPKATEVAGQVLQETFRR